MSVAYYEAFSDNPGKGNPAGVVFDSDILTPGHEMNLCGHGTVA